MSIMIRVLITVAVWVAGAYWVLVPHRWEGRIIATFSRTHGLHSHDIVGVVVVVSVTIGAWLPWKRLRATYHQGLGS